MVSQSMASLRRNPRQLLSFILHPAGNSSPSPAAPFSAVASPFSTLEDATLQPPPSTSPISRRAANSLLRSESDPNRLAEILLQSSASTPDFLLDRAPFHFAIDKLARARRLDLVERVLEPLRSDPATNERHLVRVVALYSSAGMIDHAVKAFQQIPRRTEKSLCALLGAYLDNRLPDRARESFYSVPAEIGVTPSIRSCNLLLKALCDEGHVAAAAKLVLGDMEKEMGVRPDIVSHNTLLAAYLRHGDEPSFSKIVEEIDSKGLSPNILTYNCRIAMLCRKRDAAGAEKVFDEMLTKGIRPSLVTYNTLLSGFCHEGDLGSARMLLGKLKRDGGAGVAPDGRSYTMVVRLMVEKGELGPAMELCEECLGKKWAPSFEVMRELVDWLVRDKKVAEARRLVGLMKSAVKGQALVAWIKFESALPL